MRRPIIAACLALLLGREACPQVRTITTLALEHWAAERSDGESRSAFVAEEALIIGAGNPASLIVRARYAAPSASMPYGGLGAGLSYVFSPGIYADLVATASWDTGSGAFLGEAESSFNLEGDRLYAGARERVRFSGSSFSLLTSVFAKYRALERISLWSSYTLGYESGIGIDHSFWGYVEASPASAWGVAIGGTAASFHPAGASASERLAAYSAIAGLAYRATPKLSFKYQFELFFGDRDEGKTVHALVVDAKLR